MFGTHGRSLGNAMAVQVFSELLQVAAVSGGGSRGSFLSSEVGQELLQGSRKTYRLG